MCISKSIALSFLKRTWPPLQLIGLHDSGWYQPSAHKVLIFQKIIQMKMYISCLSTYLPLEHLDILGIRTDPCGSRHTNCHSSLASLMVKCWHLASNIPIIPKDPGDPSLMALSFTVQPGLKRKTTVSPSWWCYACPMHSLLLYWKEYLLVHPGASGRFLLF